jgi:hypothetical protein
MRHPSYVREAATARYNRAATAGLILLLLLLFCASFPISPALPQLSAATAGEVTQCSKREGGMKGNLNEEETNMESNWERRRGKCLFTKALFLKKKYPIASNFYESLSVQRFTSCGI